MNIGLIGAGSWGTALAILLGSKGFQVTLLDTKKNLLKNWSKTRKTAIIYPVFIYLRI